MKQIRRKKLTVALVGALGASFFLASTEAAAQQQAQKIEKIEVTGSNIKRTDTETPSVVQVITREQIERSGATSVAELLRQVPAVGAGAATDFNSGTGFQSGNATVSLRGLGSYATLVLLNGRRLPTAPYADPNTAQGASYNLNAIPVSAIERIDVLKDGASAIYGSDAIAGVINIITRKDYKGGEVTWSHWQKLDQFSDMNYHSEQLSGTVGFGDLAKDRWNVLLSADYYKRWRQPLNESGGGVANDDYRRLNNRLNTTSELGFPANMRRQTAPGVYGTAGRLPGDARCPAANRIAVAAGANNASAPFVCAWNTFDPLEITGELERGGLMGRLTYQLTANTTAFVEGMYTKTETTYTGNPPSQSAAAPSTWLNVAGQRFVSQLVLPVGHPDNPNPFPVGLLYRFADLGNTYSKTELDSARFVAGLQGVWGAWDWESAILYAQNERADSQNNILHFPTLQAAIANGTYRFSGNAQNSQALLDSLHPVIYYDAKTETTSWDLKGSREVYSMRGGPVMLAAGMELRKETFEIQTDPRVLRGEMLGIAAQQVDADRNVWSVYGELSIPVLRNLEFQVAARYDDYSDFGGKATPKVGFKWNAMETVAFRGTYAQGFRAPSLYQSQTGDVQSFNAGIVDPLRCPGNVQAPGAEPEDCNRTISSLIRANRNLEPETSTSNSIGIIWAPTSNVSASIDRFYVHRKNFVDRFSSPFVIQQNFNGDPAFADAVIRDPNPATWLPGIPNSGPIQTTIRRFDNFGDAIVQGFDLDVSTKWAMGAWGRLGVDYYGTYYDKYIWQFSRGEAYINAAGNFWGPFETPRYRSQLNATWDYGAFTFIGRYSYTSSWEYGQPAGSGPQGQTISAPMTCFTLSAAQRALMGGNNGCTVGSYDTIDLGVNWSGIKNLKVGVLVRNVTNRVPPYDPSGNATTLGFTPAFYNPYGRYLQFSLNYKFK